MNILLTSINFPNYDSLAQLTWPNKKEYCKLYHYESYRKHTDFLGGIELGFEKIFYIKTLFEERPYLDWIWFLGCDTLITNFNIKIEDIISQYEGYSFIVGADVNGINMDSFLVKNDIIGNWILEDVWNKRNEYSKWCYEQQWFWDNAWSYPDSIKVVSQRTFNSYDYKLYGNQYVGIDKTGMDGNWAPGDFVIHWPGLSLSERISLAKNIKYKL